VLNKFFKYILFTLFIVTFAFGLNDENNLNLIAPKKLKQVEGSKGPLKSLTNDYISEMPAFNTNAVDDNSDGDGVDSNLYKKVKLIDVVLETLSRSEVLKSARESVIQYELKVKSAFADYYPTLNFSYELGRARKKLESASDFTYYTDNNYEFILKQNLYSGNATSYNVQSLVKKLDVAKNQYKVTLDEEIKKSIKAYFDVVFAKRSMKVNERNMKKLNKILQIVTTKYESGAASIGDITSIKASVANAMTKLVRIKSKFVESLRYYEYIVGDNFKKTLPYEMNFDISVKDLDSLYEHALAKNKNLINYYESIEAEKYSQKNKKSAFKPKVDFELAYGQIFESEDTTETETDLSGKVRLTYNLFNGGKDKNKVLEANSKIRDLYYKLEEEKKKIKWNLSKIHTSMESIDEALQSTKDEIIASRKMVSAYWEAFKLGEQDLPTLLQGQRQLNSAETELVNFEKNQMVNFFNVLELTGELASFFDVDPQNPKFIDFSKSDYGKTVIAKDGDTISLNLEKKKEKVKEKIKKEEEPKEVVLPTISLEEKINKYLEKFNSFDENSYMVEIGDFGSIYDAFEFMVKNKIDENSFPYSVVDKYNIKTKVAHNNFETIEKANEYITTLKEKNLDKEYQVKKVVDIKKLYDSYIKGLEVKVPKPKTKIKIVEKLIEPPVEKVFETDPVFKDRFLSSSDDFYTINVSSFTDLRKLEAFIKKNDIYEKSFFFRYGNSGELIKLVTGVYENYSNIGDEINTLILENENIYPIVEKISTVKKLYKDNLIFNEEQAEEKTLDKKVEKKEIKPIKVEEKKLEEEKTEISSEYTLNDFEKDFLSAPRDYYTITLASFTSFEEAKTFTKENNIESRSVLLLSDSGKVVVLLGIYYKRDIALDTIKDLPKKLKDNNPYIQRIFRAQDSFKRNNVENSSLIDKMRLDDDLEAKKKVEAERLAKLEEERKAKEEAERLAKLEAEKKAEAERLAKIEAEKKAKAEAERLAKLEAEKKAKEEAERLAKLEEDKKAKEEAERLAKVEAEKKAKVEAQRLAKIEEERKAKEEAERLAKLEAEKKAEAERFAKIEAEKKAKAEAQRLEKLEEERKAKEEAERLAKVEAEKKAKAEAERLSKLEEERKAKEEAERLVKLEAEKKAKEEAERLAKVEAEKKAKEEAEQKAKLKAEAIRKAQQEVERLRKERLEKEQALKRAQEEAIKMAQRKSEVIEETEAEKIARMQAEKIRNERFAKIEAQKKAQQEAIKKAQEKAQRLAKLEAEKKAKEEAQRLAKLEAEKKAKEEAERLAKIEAEKKAKEEAQRLEKLEEERKAKEEAERLEKIEAEKKAKAEAERLSKLEEERKAKEEAERLAKLEAEKKAKAEAERLAKIEAEKKAKKEAQRLAKIEEERKAKEEAERLAKLEAEKKAKEEAQRVVTVKKDIEDESKKTEFISTKQQLLSNQAIQEIDFGMDGKKVEKLPPYKQRVEEFKKVFNNASAEQYTIKVITLKLSEVDWFIKARGLGAEHIVIVKDGKKATIYYGVYDEISQAKKQIDSLHPIIYESNPPVVKIGSVR